jgi:hypothetical protein
MADGDTTLLSRPDERLHAGLRVLCEGEAWRRLNYVHEANKIHVRWFQATQHVTHEKSTVDQRVDKIKIFPCLVETRRIIQGIS